jgi:hypothetical protein
MQPNGGASLWYDDRDIPFLKQDETDAANIQSVKSGTMRTLIDAGFEPVSVIDAINNDDLAMLTHTGLYSVQLQPTPTPEVYLAGVMANIEQQNANTAKILIDSGFEPDSVMEAINTQDMTKLSHTGLYSVNLNPIGNVTQGKGSLVQGSVTPAGPAGSEGVQGGAPAMVGQNGARALLERYLPSREGDE